MRYMLLCRVGELPKNPQLAPQPNEHLQMNFYSRLGILMASWQFIESSLSGVYFCATTAPPEACESIKAAFYANSAFSVRLATTSEVIARSVLSDQIKAEWKPIAVELKRCSELRNKVAHGVVYWAPYETDSGDLEMFIARNFDNPKHALSSERIYFSDLEEISKQFDIAHAKLYEFYLALLQGPYLQRYPPKV